MTEPLDAFDKIQPLVQLEIKNSLDAFSAANQYNLAKIPDHSHTGTDSNNVDFSNLNNRTRFVLYRIVNPTVNTAIANVVGGDFVMPFSGYITAVGATVDMEGTTNVTTIDINKTNSVPATASVLLTKITIDSGEKTSRTATTPAVINTATSSINFSVGDIFTFDVDAVSTTPAQGLTVFINVIET